MLAGLELSPVGFVCFWKLLFSIGQTQSEERFSNHGNDLGGYGTLIIPSTALSQGIGFKELECSCCVDED